MIQVLAIVAADPMSWPVLAVLTLAAGMYPLGFMFGVCSECCGDGCPDECNNCTWLNHFDFDETEQYFSSVDFSIEGPEDAKTYTIANPSNSGTGTGGAGQPGRLLVFSSTLSDGGDPFEDNVTLLAISFDAGGPCYDDCGCVYLCYEVALDFASTNLAGFSEFDRFRVPFADCSVTESTAEITIPASWLSFKFDFDPINYTRSPAFSDVTLTITITADDPPCECGACCDENGDCKENWPEFGCENTLAGDWQGVGTDCDPDPCT